ncbi:unnamed protein product, partial [Aureobasidium mustum]
TIMAASKALKRSAEETATTSKGQSGPPKKKQCRKRTCLVCDTKKHYTQFPSQTKVSSHDHGANVCRLCYFSHLEVEIDSKNWDEVACPECPTKLTYQEVESMTNAENFAKATLAADPDFRFCFSSACESGQLHPGGTSEPIFSCQVCRHKHCVVCETNWHEDQTCEEFQAELHRNTENDEKSEKEVEKISKPCPECRVPIQKNKGCDHMTCQCRHQFCWICSASYSDIAGEGNHRHEKSCTHYRAAPSAEALEAQRRRTEEAREAQRRRTEAALEVQRRRNEEARQRREESDRRTRELQEQTRRQLQADQQAIRRPSIVSLAATPAPTSGLAPTSVHIEGARDTNLSEHVLARLAHRAPTTAAAPQPTQNEEGDRRTAPTPTPP